MMRTKKMRAAIDDMFFVHPFDDDDDDGGGDDDEEEEEDDDLDFIVEVAMVENGVTVKGRGRI